MALSTFFNQIVPDYIYDNYYTIDGYAYTEDHLIVNQLFVYKIPSQTTDCEIRKYFSQYGNINNVHFFSVNNQNYPNVAVVIFESPTTAARVLNFYHKTGDGRDKALYRIKVCDSQDKPNCHFTSNMLQDWNICPKKMGEEAQFFLPFIVSSSILVLNDNCLDNIIRFLPIPSQINFGRTCSRISEVLQKTSKSLYRTLSVDRFDNLTEEHIRDFFEVVGANIIRIKGRLKIQTELCILESISIYCINLEEVDLDPYLCGHRLLVQLFRNLKKLKTLIFSEYFELPAKNLKWLSPTIESVSVNCIDFKDEHIIWLLKSPNKLKKLNLGGNMCLNDTLVTAMVMSCQNLETLAFGYYQSDYGLLAKLPKLKNLTVFLRMESSSCSSLLTQLIEHKSHMLEFLRIDGGISDNDAQQISHLNALRSLDCSYSDELTDNGLRYFYDLEHFEEINLRYCTNITNTALIELVLKCMKLQRVELLGCKLILNNLIFELIQKMQRQIQNKTFKRTDPVTLMTNHIQDDILNDPEYQASSHLINLNLEYIVQKEQLVIRSVTDLVYIAIKLSILSSI